MQESNRNSYWLFRLLQMGRLGGQALSIGNFVAVRGCRWLVQDNNQCRDLRRAKPSCIEDDAQGERVEVVWKPRPRRKG